MTTKQYDSLIKNYIDKRDFVKIKRTVTDGEADVSGFILQQSKDFLLIQIENEFYLNGYAIIQKDHFDSIRNNKYDKTMKKILRGEKVFDTDYGIKSKINLKSWETIFTDLKQNDFHVIVECEDLKEPKFVIGPIKKINKKSVSILYYDPTGLLDRKPTSLNYKDITIVKFDNRYTSIFRKYLRKN